MTRTSTGGEGFQGPKRGADRAVLLAHGAGADMHAAALMVVAAALADAKIPTLRFNFPYKAAGRRSPDRPPVLMGAVRDARDELAARARVEPDRIVLGGRSMGGRMGSMVAAEDGAYGLALLGYPLHPPGKPQQRRVEHFGKLTMPVLFASGTRDPFGTPDELQRDAANIMGRVSFYWVETGDHAFKPLKASGVTPAAALDRVAAAVVAFVAGLSE
jgi:uncharacterized protein